MSMLRRHRWPARLLFVLGGIAIAFGLFYLGLQIAGHFVFVEISSPTMSDDPFNIAYRCAEAAFGSETEFAIRCFGDSFTQGVGASNRDQTYPAHLERFLCARYPRLGVEVINYGLGGNNSSEALASVRSAIDASGKAPTVAVVMIGVNNEWNLHWCSALAEGYAPFPKKLKWLRLLTMFPAEKLATILFLRGKSILGRGTSAREERWMLTFRNGEGKPLVDSADAEARKFIESWLNTDLSRIAAAMRRVGWNLLVAGYHESWANDYLARFATERNLPFCPPPRGGNEWGERGWLSKDGRHPNDRGYAVFAQNIADCLVRFDMIPNENRP